MVTFEFVPFYRNEDGSFKVNKVLHKTKCVGVILMLKGQQISPLLDLEDWLTIYNAIKHDLKEAV